MKWNFKITPDELAPRQRFYYLLWEIACAGFLILWYGNFAYIFLNAFIQTHHINHLLYLFYEVMIVLFLLIRRLPKEVSFSPYDWFVALAGTLGSTLLRPVEVGLLPAMPFLVVFQVAGIIISGIGLLSLAKSYGTVPANRGIKTNGLYRYIRHPLYSGYFFALTSFVLQNASLYNFAILVVFLSFQVLRIFAEEKLLKQDPEYVAYTEKTRWRIIPYVW